MNFKTAG